MKKIVTTSWDDGHKLDLKLAHLLQKYNMPATFYVSPECREFSKRICFQSKKFNFSTKVLRSEDTPSITPTWLKFL